MTKKTAASVNNSVMNNNFKAFNLEEALKKNAKVVTRDGKKVKVVCETRGQILVTVYDRFGFGVNYKYNLDGSKYNNLIHNLDLMLA